MPVVERNTVCLGGGYGRVGARDEGAADGDLGGEADNRACYVRCGESADGGVNVARVGGEEGAEEEEELAGAVGGGVAGTCQYKSRKSGGGCIWMRAKGKRK